MPEALPHSIRLAAIMVLAVAAVVASLFAADWGDNVFSLSITIGLLLLALTLAFREVTTGIADFPVMATMAAILLLLLVITHQYAISPEDSLAVSFTIAIAPLFLLLSIALSSKPQAVGWLYIVALLIITVLCLYSSFHFLASGVRPTAPMADPNNFATLVYLAWIPLVHFYLCTVWEGRQPRPWAMHLVMSLFTVVLLAALVATRSRVALLIVFVALLVWFCLAAVRRKSVLPVLIQASVVLAVVAVVSPMLGSTVAERVSSDAVSSGFGIRLVLIGSALQLLPDYPLGTGIFGFSLLYDMNRAVEDQVTAGYFVHNDYVQLLLEGGPLLFLFSLAVFVAVVALLIRQVFAAPEGDQFRRAGFVLAVAALMMHANLNFVFYILPLSLILGLYLAIGGGSGALLNPWQLLSPSASTESNSGGDKSCSEERLRTARPGWGRVLPVGGVLAMVWLAYAYLLVDVAIAGSLKAQPGIPFTKSIQGDGVKQLRFSRNVQRINPSRGLPFLGEALVLRQMAASHPDFQYLIYRSEAAFREAIAVDPWNPMTFREFARFRIEFGVVEPTESDERESAEYLLLQAVLLNPAEPESIDALLAYYESTEQWGKHYVALRQIVRPWLELILRIDALAYDRYLGALLAHAQHRKELELYTELRETEARLEGLRQRIEARIG
jgi:O-antigen ligase